MPLVAVPVDHQLVQHVGDEVLGGSLLVHLVRDVLVLDLVLRDRLDVPEDLLLKVLRQRCPSNSIG